MYDSRGEPVDPRDVLDPSEMPDLSIRRAQAKQWGKVLPTVDENGYGTDGYEWQGSPDGRPR